MAVAEELALFDDHLEQFNCGVSRILADAFGPAERSPTSLVVQNQLLQALTLDEVQNPWARDQIDASLDSQDRSHRRLGASLPVWGLGVRQGHVGVGRQSQVFADLAVSNVDHHGLDGTDWRGPMAHVERRRAATVDERRSRLRELVDDDTREGLSAMLHNHFTQRDGCRCSTEWHRDELDRDSGARAIDDRLTSQVAPLQRWRRTAIKNRQWLVSQRLGATADSNEHVSHHVECVFAEGAGNHRFRRVRKSNE